MLLKFSNILARGVASRHLEVRHVSDLALQHVVSWSRGIHLFASSDVGSHAGSESKLRSLRLECLGVLLVVAWPWHVCVALWFKATLQLDAHGVVGTSLLGERLTGVVGTGTWNDEPLLIDELDSHVEARLFLKGLRLRSVVAGGGHKLRMTVVKHLPLIASKAVVRRSRLDG